MPLYIQEFTRFVRQEEEDSGIQTGQQKRPNEMEALSDHDGIPPSLQECVRLVENEEYKPDLQTKHEEEDGND
jgi:hypothetical protein